MEMRTLQLNPNLYTLSLHFQWAPWAGNMVHLKSTAWNVQGPGFPSPALQAKECKPSSVSQSKGEMGADPV